MREPQDIAASIRGGGAPPSPPDPTPASSILPTIVHNARTLGDAIAIRFLSEGSADGLSEAVSFAAFDRRVRSVAAGLRREGLTGHHALLLFPPGLDFITAFFACLYEGVVAVPAYPPDPVSLERTLPRLRAIARDSHAAAVLTTAFICEMAQPLREQAPELGSARWLPIEQLELEPIAAPRERAAEDVAFLQYTSGSTGSPKGVRVTHGNILHNSEAIRRVGRHDRHSLSVNWLPCYHDMGLLGGIIQPLYVGFPSVLMSPLSFLKRPGSWLAAMTAFHGTTSAFPNFALDLCTRKVSDEELSTLDLRAWRTAWNGAEPVRAGSLERFAERFSRCGFDRRALLPVYGLAESTLIVSGERRSEHPAREKVSREALAMHRIAAPGSSEDGATLVSCGAPVPGLEVVIVDPERCVRCAPGEVGELWIRGGSVARGYWNRPEESMATFQARLLDTGEGPFLRTGDLGFLARGEVFVTGRHKDLIILRGKNHYPQDLEEAAVAAHPAVRPGACAAVPLESDGGEQLAIAAEVRDGLDDEALAQVARAIREAVGAASGVLPAVVALLSAGTLPKTSSGKLQRAACQRALADDALPALRIDRGSVPPPAVGRPTPAPAQARNGRIEQVTREVLARVTGHPPSAFGEATRLVAYLGFDSLRIAEVEAELDAAFGALGEGLFGDVSVTFGSLTHAIAERVAARQTVPLEEPSQAAVALASALSSPPREQPSPPPQLVHHVEPTAPVVREERIEEFAEVGEIRSMLMLFQALELENPYFRTVEGTARDTATVGGRPLLNFATYNYLGLAGDPRVNAAAANAVARYGTSASASRLASGDRPPHRALEARLAGFLGCDDALVFASGHATNVATVSALVGKGDLIVHDALVHDSLLAGAKLSGATRLAFPHNDLETLEVLLQERRAGARRALILVEGAYSMDGDLPPLQELVALKKRHGALLMVDEAHSIGVVGPTGRGIGEHARVARADVDVWMGTLSKALASCGGYVAGSRALIELLRYKAGGFVYAAAISPANAAAADEALRLLEAEPERALTLQRRARRFVQLCRERGIDTGLSEGTAIVPAIVGASVRCLQVAAALERRGVHAPPIFHPAVEEDRARLRFFVSALHSEAQLEQAANALRDALREHPAQAPHTGPRPRPKVAPPGTAATSAGPALGNRRIFVTGGSGFIGSRVVRRLIDQGAQARCLMRPTSKTHRLAGLSFEVEAGDLLDRAALERGMRGCDAVIHLACASSWSDVRALGDRIDTVAVDGTRNVLEAAKAAGVKRVVHVSSVAALNASERPELFDESARYTIGSRGLSYSLAKHRAEEVALEAARAGLDVVVVSPAEVFGADDDGLVTAGSIADILQASPPVACDGGTSVVHVDDVADGILAALTRGRSGERYILGGDNLSVRELTEQVLRLAGRSSQVVDIPNRAAIRLCQGMARVGLTPPLALDVLEYATLYWFVDSSKARRELGFTPRSAERTLAPVVEWLLATGRARGKQARAPIPEPVRREVSAAPDSPAQASAPVRHHRVVSVSLGAKNRDHRVEVELVGRRFTIERRGTGGDFAAFLRTFRELDGTVDAFGIGGAELHMSVGGQRYEWKQLRPVREAIVRSRLGDGNGIKHLLAKYALKALLEHGVALRGKRALVTAAVDRYGMASALADAGCQLVLADLMMIGVPVPLTTLEAVERLAPVIMPVLSRLPFSWIYPVGEDEKRLPERCRAECEQADVIAGDYLQVQANLPANLKGKIIITNTTTARDVEELTRRNLHLLVTTTPRMDGRSFGTNVIEAVVRCFIDKPDDQIRDADFIEWIERIPLKPQVHVLNPA